MNHELTIICKPAFLIHYKILSRNYRGREWKRKHKIGVLCISSWRNSPTRARTATFLRFLDHRLSHNTLLPGNTQQSQETEKQTAGGILGDPRLRPLGHWDRQTVRGTVAVFSHLLICEGSLCSKLIDLAFSPRSSVVCVRSCRRLMKCSKV
jgi:hypothetical protein